MISLTYRDIRESDFSDLHAIVSHWSVVRQLGGWPWPASEDFTQSRCCPYDGDGFVWAICIDDKLVGSIGVTNGDLGYMLSPACHGHGIMSQAARRAVDQAFATTDRQFLTGSTWHDNPASYRLLQKLGYRHWQTRYIRAKARNMPTLVHNQRLERSDWYRLSSQAQ